ncbi:MAG: hypothetical protein WCA84_04980 [Ignavibacteriaceae bacterium]
MKVLKLNPKQNKIKEDKDTPPARRRLLKRIKSVKDIDTALSLQRSVIGLYQRGEIDSNEAKSLSYLLQNFVSIYRIQFETSEIYDIIYYEVNVKVREVVKYFQEYITSICEELQLSEEQEKKIEERYLGRQQKIIDDIKKLRSKIKEEINKNTSFKLKSDDDSSKKVNLIMNEIANKLNSQEKYQLYDELQKSF